MIVAVLLFRGRRIYLIRGVGLRLVPMMFDDVIPTHSPEMQTHHDPSDRHHDTGDRITETNRSVSHEIYPSPYFEPSRETLDHIHYVTNYVYVADCL